MNGREGSANYHEVGLDAAELCDYQSRVSLHKEGEGADYIQIHGEAITHV